MNPVERHPARSERARWIGLLAGLTLAALGGWAMAQAPSMPRAAEEALPAPQPVILHDSCEPTINGFPPALPTLPERRPRAPDETGSFVDSLGNNDATFEVVVGEGRLLTLKEDLAVPGKPRPLVAVGDPSIIDFVVVGPRQIRIIGQRLGSTDLSIITADNRVYGFQVQVVADLRVLRCQLKAMFPDASLRLAQLKDHIVVEGEARDTAQVSQILDTIRAYLVSLQAAEVRKISGQAGGAPPGTARLGAPAGAAPAPVGPTPEAGPGAPGVPGGAGRPGEAQAERGLVNAEAVAIEPRIINLIRVPGSQQVMLKVRVAELNRSALRSIGGDFLAVDPHSGAIVGTKIGGAAISATATFTDSGGVTGVATGSPGANTTVFGIFSRGDFELLFNALRTNSILKVLAEPNLVTMSGHPASFLAGGEFPVPVPQAGGIGGSAVITVAFREFGVRLGFVPYILDDGVIRLTVDPEVSNVDFTIGAVLVPGGTPVPGLNIRKSHTTVELRQGQTLAIAGLMQLTLSGNTSRIPGLGDLPYIGPFFSNTSNNRVEKELVVLVTPYLIEPMNHGQVPPTPGDEVKEPTDLETYLLNRIEGRTGRDFRSTTHGEDPLHCNPAWKQERDHVRGVCGFSE